jgi:hypothetical protein
LFLGSLVFTASRLLPPTKSVTQAKRQSTCCLEGACLPIFHCRRYIPLESIILLEIQSISLPCDCAVFCHSEPKVATLKFLCRKKNLPPTAAVNQKHTPDLGVSRQALSNGGLLFF